MSTDIYATAAQLRADGTPFVLATVVASYPPQSVRPGAKAIVYADGRVDGWIGGGCVRPVVVREAVEALADRRPRLVRMNASPTQSTRHGDIREYPMTCQGEGGVEVYLEPVLPAQRLVVLGHTPVALAVARLGVELSFDVIVASPATSSELLPAEARLVGDARVALAGAGSTTWVVVATMGAGDEDALTAAVESDAIYIGLVASRKKAGYLVDYVRAGGVPVDRLARVKFPAGLDFGTTPAEIALSILAEIEQKKHEARRREASDSARSAAGPVAAPFPTDPVCGMSVNPAEARHTLVVGSETIYFCCPGCKKTYERTLSGTRPERASP
jgi:xanthine dehydrogenase accessory factor